jgi:hypothetical protein
MLSIQKQRRFVQIVVTPSLTSFPALSHDEARTKIIALLQTNGGCRLPCWWGITPGETHLETVHAFLSPMLKTGYAGDKLISYYDPSGSTPERPALPGLELHFQDSIVQAITVFSVQGSYLSELDINHIFHSYGKPDKIYLRAFPFTSYSLVQIFLHYPRQGIAIEYRFHTEEADQLIRLCNLDQPAKEADFHLWEYDPPTVQDFYIIARDALWHPSEYKILPLDEASSWTADSFYESFQLPEVHTACIETATILWEENR